LEDTDEDNLYRNDSDTDDGDDTNGRRKKYECMVIFGGTEQINLAPFTYFPGLLVDIYLSPKRFDEFSSIKEYKANPKASNLIAIIQQSQAIARSGKGRHRSYFDLRKSFKPLYNDLMYEADINKSSFDLLRLDYYAGLSNQFLVPDYRDVDNSIEKSVFDHCHIEIGITGKVFFLASAAYVSKRRQEGNQLGDIKTKFYIGDLAIKEILRNSLIKNFKEIFQDSREDKRNEEDFCNDAYRYVSGVASKFLVSNLRVTNVFDNADPRCDMVNFSFEYTLPRSQCKVRESFCRLLRPSDNPGRPSDLITY
jgi:hypothetical protein